MATELEKKRFVKGGAPGPGRPPGKKTDYRAIFEQCVTPESFFRIISRAVDDAIRGDHRARVFVVSHLIAPIPKTLKVENPGDSPTEGRKLIDSLIELVPDASLQAVLAATQRPE